MRSRKSMLMVLTVLFVFVTTLIPMSAVAAGERVDYLDVTPNSDGTWTNAAGSLTYGYVTGGLTSLSTPVYEYATNPITGGASMKVTPGGVGRNNPTGADFTASNVPVKEVVTWYEWDLYYKDAVADTAFVGNALNLLNINADGSVKLAHYGLSNCAPAGTIKPDTMYHIVIAVDPLTAVSGNAHLTLWINGVQSGFVSNRGHSETGTLNYSHFNISGFSATDAIYIDRVKLYTTSSATSVADYDPTAYAADAKITSSSVKIEDGKILVAAGTKISELDAAIEDTLTVSYWNGATKIDAADYATTDAIGKTVVTAKNSVVMTYTVAELKGKEWVNINYNDGTQNNSAADAKDFSANHNGASATATVVDDAVKGNKVLKIDYPAGKAGQMIRFGNESFNSTGHNSQVTVYEMSFKFVDVITNIYFGGISKVFEIYENGAINAVTHPTTKTPIAGVTIEPNKWYNIVVATDALDTTMKSHVWLNGEKIVDGSTYEYNFNSDSLNQLRVQLGAHSSGVASTLLIDDVKVYTDVKSITASGFNPAANYTGTDITVGSGATLTNDFIYVPYGTTVAQLKGLVSADTDATVTYTTAAGAAIDDNATAIGSVVSVSNGVGVKHYTVGNNSFQVVENYLDMGVNATGTAQTNAAVANRTFNNALGSGTNFAYVDDATKGHKVVKLYNSPVWRSDAFAADATDGVMWYDMSFKFEGSIPTMDMRATGAIFGIQNGRLWLSSIQQNFASYGSGIEIPVDLVTDKWYNFKIAVDYVDKYEQVTIVEGEEVKTYLPKWYLWIDGEFMDRSGRGFTLAKDTGADATSDKVDFFTTIADGSAIYLDALKMYKTSTPVRMANGEFCFDPTEGFDMTVSGTTYRVDAAFMRNGYAYQPNVYITNATAEDKTAVVTFAWYNESGLINFALANDEPITIKAGSKAAVVVPGNIPDGATYGRVFVWDSFETLKPAFASTDVTFN